MAATLMTPGTTAATLLDRSYLEIRCKMLDLAAHLDRLERADDFAALQGDPRLKQFAQALDILSKTGFDRAEKLQLLFSDPYDPSWVRPTPR